MKRFIIIMMMSHTMVMAQNKLSGTVKNTHAAPLQGANIVLAGPSSLAGTSNFEGKFTFNKLKKGHYTIEVSFVGYKTYTTALEIPYVGELTVELEEDPYLADEVVVIATRAGDKAPLAFSEIDKVTLEETNMGKDMPYLLENTPSVVTTSDGGTGVGYTGIRIRGSDPTRVNVTLNGIPYNDSESQGVYWVDLPDFASSVESIQVQRGVGTSTNGAGAFGASINVQTNGLNKAAYATFDNSFGSFNTRKHTLNAGTGLLNDKFTVDARLSKIYTDGYLDRAYADLDSWYVSGGYYGKSSLLKFNIFSGHETTYQAWYGTPEARVRNDVQGMQDYISRNFLSQEDADNLLNSGRTYNYYTYDNEVDDYTQTHYQLLYSQDISESFLLNAALHYTKGGGYYEQYKAGEDLADYGITEPIIGTDTITTSDLIRRRWLDNDFYGLTFSGHYSPSQSTEIILGGAWNRYEGDHFGEVIWAEFAGDSQIRDRYYDNYAEKTDYNVYLKGSIDLSSSLSAFGDLQFRGIDYLLVGTDNDQQLLGDNFNWQFFNPKIGLSYFLDAGRNLYASFSVANKEPSRSDIIDNLTGTTPIQETLHDYELGYRQTKSPLQLNANLYYMDYVNQLVLTGQLNDVGSSLRANVPKSYRLGLELEVGYQVTDNFQLSGNLTISENKIKEYTEYIYDYGVNWDEYNEVAIVHKNTNIAYSPSVIAGGLLRFTPISGLNLVWSNKYVGDQYLDNTSNEQRKLDGYYLSDFRANYGFSALSMKRISLNFAVYNIFNKHYEANGYTWGYMGGGNEVRENFYYPQAGTNFMVGITLKL